MKRLIFTSLICCIAIYFTSAQSLYRQTYKFGKILEYIDSYYVDSVDIINLTEEAIKTVLTDLDPHSTYLTKEEVYKNRENLQGSFEGIGISFNILKDTLFVITPISGGPSEKVGILAGDRIIKVDGENIAGVGITNEDVFRLLKGKKGTEVVVTVLRRKVKAPLDFTIIRDRIPIFSIDASYMINANTGYIKLNRFAQTTSYEFSQAAGKLKEQNAENLILDLTGNGGGYLDKAIDLADEFLKKGRLIVYTEGVKSPRRESYATTRGSFETGNIIVLIDEGSASASEIVSGAIQDWDRGIIIGRRSFGKGLVQRPLSLPDSSELRLTVAKYYTPSGRLIQKPYDNGNSDYERDLIERYYNGEMMNRDSIQLSKDKKKYTMVKKRPVYGGGGIMPDIFVPLDTLGYSDYYRDLIRTGILNRFVLNYVDKNRADFKAKYPEFSGFNADYNIDNALLEELYAYAEKEDLKKNPEDIAKSEKHLRNLMKAYIARDLWQTSEFYEVINQLDSNVSKAVEVMNNWEHYKSIILN